MKVHYDEKSDAIYIRLDDSKIIDSQEVEPGIILDFNADGQVVGVEILRVKKRVPLANLKQMQLSILVCTVLLNLLKVKRSLSPTNVFQTF